MKAGSSITTKYGDTGFTRLCSGTRVRKDDIRVWVCGEVDELVCVLGAARAFSRSARMRKDLEILQRALFRLGAEAATNRRRGPWRVPRITKADVEELDELCSYWDRKSTTRDFVLPGNTRAAVFADLARAVARRGERRLVSLCRRGMMKNRHALAWINRVSDLLWLMARAAEKKSTPARVRHGRRRAT